MRKHNSKKFEPFKKIFFISFLFLFTAYACKDKDDDENKTEQIPIVTTTSVTDITSNSAICGGVINFNGNFPITAKGICWSTTPLPTTSNYTTSDGTGSNDFTSTLTGLAINTKYYVRAYATNRLGTGYGNEISFTTRQGNIGTITDIDGNIYNTIIIGSQIWMVENLQTTKFNDGTPIRNIKEANEWINTDTSAYCWYNNDSNTYKKTYGAIYNWSAIHSNKLCPIGWHVPSDSEWTILINYLGGDSLAGGAMKESGTSHWSSPNTGASNSSYFYAMPSGSRNGNLGTFVGLKDNCFWWSSTQSDATDSWCRIIYYSSKHIYRENLKKSYGLSVRCVKDN